MPASSAPAAAAPYLVHTHPGDGTVSTERFRSAAERLDTLRHRVQERSPEGTCP